MTKTSSSVINAQFHYHNIPTSSADAIKAIEKAVEIHTDMGRFIMVAKHHENIAEIYEKELEDQEKAIGEFISILNIIQKYV